MKLISLNIWRGHEHENLLSFIESNKDADIFCFQEVMSSSDDVYTGDSKLNILDKIGEKLPEHHFFFSPIQTGWTNVGRIKISAIFGQAVFIKKNIRIIEKGFVFTHGSRDSMVGSDDSTIGCGFQYVLLDLNGGLVMIINVHGIPEPGNKLDTPERLLQSHKVLDFLKTIGVEKAIICGDFNLLPETESIYMFEGDMENLIKKFNIADTRGKFHNSKYGDYQRFADYTFTSKNIKVSSFSVPELSISDHLPMIMEFDW